MFDDNPKSILPGGLKRGPHEKLHPPFSRGGPKEEIQQWRQGRSRPGEKETFNIMLREKYGLDTKVRNSYGRGECQVLFFGFAIYNFMTYQQLDSANYKCFV